MSKKVTQKEIRKYLYETPRAIDCTHMNTDDYKKIIEEEGWIDEIAYSCGMYGCNGVFYIGHNTGKYYIIADRSTAIYIFH